MSLALSKYAGSHAWLAKARPEVFPVPWLHCRVLVPFCGAGSVVFELYAGRYPLTISDKNPRLMNAWRQIRDDVASVINALERIAEEWAKATAGAPDRPTHDERSRVVFESARAALDAGNDVARAARVVAVMRMAFNGLWRVNRGGTCTSPHGKPAPGVDLVRAVDLRRMSGLLGGVEIRCEDFAETLRRARDGDATYLDPPFQGCHTAFCADGSEWEARQTTLTLPGLAETNARERLASLLPVLHERGVAWTLSDADTAVTRLLYAAWPFEVITRQNSVTCKGGDRANRASELLVTNVRGRARGL